MIIINKVDTKYMRYKLIERDGSWFVVDVFSNFLIYVLPVFRWVIPFKAYEINLEQLNVINTNTKKKLTNLWLVPMFATAVIVSRILSDLMQDFVIYSISEIESIIFLAIITIGVVSFKIFKGMREQQAFDSVFVNNTYPLKIFEFSVEFKTVNRSYFLLMISVQVIFYILLLLFCYISLISPSVFSYGLFALSLILNLFISANIKLPNTIRYNLKEIK